jgi:PAS domain S-box-containing protein
MREVFAICEIMYDNNGKPYDFRFLDIDPAFERLIGIKREEVLGRTISKVFPDKDYEWIEAFCEVCISCKKAKLQKYSSALNGYFEVLAYNPVPFQLAALFRDHTEINEAEKNLKHALEVNKKLRRFLKTAIVELKQL